MSSEDTRHLITNLTDHVSFNLGTVLGLREPLRGDPPER